MKRLIFVLLITATGVIASFIDAFYGLLLYTWYSFSSPLELTFGQLEDTRLSLLVGAVLILTTFHQRRQILVKHRISLLAGAFLFACFCSLAVQMKFGLSFIMSELELVIKILMICLLAPVLLDTVERIRWYILVIVISGAVLGAYYGVFGLFAGSTSISGPGRIGDNNGYAVFLTGILPLIFFAGRYLPDQIPSLARGVATFVLLASNVIAIGLTFSRGGFLAACSVLLLLVAQLRSRAARIIGWGVLVPFAFFSIVNILQQDPNLWRIPDGAQSDSVVARTVNGYLDRLATLRQDLEGEESASGRLHFWAVALQMVEENPLFGVGLNRYSHEYANYDFSEGRYGRVRAVHNTLLSVLSETGFFGFLAFIGIVVYSLLIQHFAKRQFRHIPDKEVTQELSDYISMIRISLLGFLVGGMFVTTTYQEIFWVLISLSIAIEQVTYSLLPEPAAA